MCFDDAIQVLGLLHQRPVQFGPRGFEHLSRGEGPDSTTRSRPSRGRSGHRLRPGPGVGLWVYGYRTACPTHREHDEVGEVGHEVDHLTPR